MPARACVSKTWNRNAKLNLLAGDHVGLNFWDTQGRLCVPYGPVVYTMTRLMRSSECSPKEAAFTLTSLANSLYHWVSFGSAANSHQAINAQSLDGPPAERYSRR